MSDDITPEPRVERRLPKQFKQMKTTPDWLFASAKAHARWGDEDFITEAEFDQACLDAASVTCR
jgi:hypothetical protein